jgi:hypothetical protein
VWHTNAICGVDFLGTRRGQPNGVMSRVDQN